MKIEGEPAVYHCISRIVGGEFLIDASGKERFRRMMWNQAQFCGLQVLAYCLMSNHIHILVRVPIQRDLSDREFLDRAAKIYDPKRTEWLKEANRLLAGAGSIGDGLRQSLRTRMGDVSLFMKELKQRFTNWHNRRHKRFGTLWAQRFRSVLVEDDPHYIALVAAYIDLNPVRAGLVVDPKDYRFCSYAEALAGGKLARQGITDFSRDASWKAVAAEYRQRLFVTGGRAGRSDKAAMSRDQIKEVLDRGGELSVPELLRLRVCYMTAGAALGSEEFIGKVFDAFREQFSPARQTGPRRARHFPEPKLSVARNLQSNVFS